MPALKEGIVLSCENLSKSFENNGEQFWALKNCSFELKRGEIVGVIGRNGAGKSTLLKVLSKITTPTNGKVIYEGKLASIIEIGTGFHLDLSGKENVFLSASILGYKKQEVKALYDEIVAFSELEEFMDMAVKHFSSGMYLRLAFSIAFHLSPDILLLDEILAVGDNEFRRKCYRKVRALREDGVAILFVSHQMEPVIEFGDRCMWIEKGEICQVGNPIDVIEKYLESGQEKTVATNGQKQGILKTDVVSIEKISCKAKGKTAAEEIFMGDEVEIEILAEKLDDECSVELVVSMANLNGVRVLMDSFAFRKDYKAVLQDPGTYSVICRIPAHLLNRGVYSVNLMVAKNYSFEQEFPNVLQFKVQSENVLDFDLQISTVIRPHLEWEIKKTSSDK